MYFLRTDHVEDDDYDYFKFVTLERAVNFVIGNRYRETGFDLSDTPHKGIPESDYELVA